MNSEPPTFISISSSSRRTFTTQSSFVPIAAGLFTMRLQLQAMTFVHFCNPKVLSNYIYHAVGCWHEDWSSWDRANHECHSNGKYMNWNRLEIAAIKSEIRFWWDYKFVCPQNPCSLGVPEIRNIQLPWDDRQDDTTRRGRRIPSLGAEDFPTKKKFCPSEERNSNLICRLVCPLLVGWLVIVAWLRFGLQPGTRISWLEFKLQILANIKIYSPFPITTELLARPAAGGEENQRRIRG